MEGRDFIDARMHRANLAGLRPLDTSTLGPIRIDTDVEARRARIVREALRSLCSEPGCGDLFTHLAQQASDTALAKLGRLLR